MEQIRQRPLDRDDDDGSESEDESPRQDEESLVEVSNATPGKKWVTEPPAAWTKRRKADIVTEKPGPRGRAKSVTTEGGAFNLFIDNEMIERIVEATNYEIHRKRPEENPTYADTCPDEIRCFIGVLLFRGLNHDIKNRVKDIWYDEETSRCFYRASMSKNRYEFLISTLSFHDQTTLRREIITDAYAKVRWIIDRFERNARLYHKHTELVCLDETLRNFFARECDLLFFLPDKPGQMGLFFYTLGDGIDRYFSRVLPKVKPAVSMSEKEAAQKTHELVMDITSDIHGTGRNLTADRGFSAVQTALDLYEMNVTYVGTIKKNMTGLPGAAKDFKGRELLSTEFFWKQGSSLMLASYFPKKNKPVLVLSTAHDQPVVDGDAKKKPEVVLFYNEQRCGVDVVNRMLKDCRSQPKTDDYRIAVFTFLLDLATVNGQTILQYNQGKKGIRRQFIRNLIHQLTAPWLKHRFLQKHHKRDTVNAIIRCLKQCAPEFNTDTPAPVKPPGVKAKCFLCIDELKKAFKGEPLRKKRRNLNKHQWFCPDCRLAICTKPNHRVYILSMDKQVCQECAKKQ